MGERTGVSRVGKEDVDEVWKEDRPEDGNSAEKEEDAEEEGDAERMCKDNQGLETPF